MPHKVAIIPELDELTPEGRAVGACNTVFWRNSRLIGTNTDIVGVRESFYQNVSRQTFEGRPGLVLGGGKNLMDMIPDLVLQLATEML